MDYNTQRKKLIMPEYGRNVQKMIEYVKGIEDKEKRNEQIKTVLTVMGILNPSLRDISDFRHKLWDHVQIISDFDIDIESPYPTPTKETFSTKPHPIPLETTPLKAAHYGRNIQNMIDMVAAKEDGEVKDNMVRVLANYMRQQYLIWNKDSVTEETIFADIKRLSGGKLVVGPNIHIGTHKEGVHNFKEGGHSFNKEGGHNPQHRDNQHRNRNLKFRNNNKGRNKIG
ncbi:hypothetical protein SDC9_55279 [bioreactor metagenome]|uniref:DUF4290 domain-containing protein n=1 Tax=bioreactor metagenome TaxID=1076179 RepID=A0A644X3T5_9ZZZZ